MTAMPVEVRLAEASESAVVSAMLARAFHRDPFMTWLFGGTDARRAAHLQQLFRIFIALALKQGTVYTTPQYEGAALWFFPDRWRADTITQLRWLWLMLRAAGPRQVGRRIRAVDHVDQFHPPAPHYYLMVLGTDPDAQGRGIGSALMAPVLARCDAEGVPAYLEASAPRNVPYYEHRGFQVQREIQVPDGGPPVWLMWREPESGPAA